MRHGYHYFYQYYSVDLSTGWFSFCVPLSQVGYSFCRRALIIRPQSVYIALIHSVCNTVAFPGCIFKYQISPRCSTKDVTSSILHCPTSVYHNYNCLCSSISTVVVERQNYKNKVIKLLLPQKVELR